MVIIEPFDQCDYQATKKGDLKRHIESIHEGVHYTCDQCEYKATQKGDLRKHVKSKQMHGWKELRKVTEGWFSCHFESRV